MQKSTIMTMVGGGLLIALLLGGILITSGGGASATKSQGVTGGVTGAQSLVTEPAAITIAEANAWAEARAANTPAAYNIYLAAFPQGAFENQAHEAKGAAEARVVAPAPAATKVTRVVEHSIPSHASVRSRCDAYVNRTLSSPNKVNRTVGGAAAGCAVGAIVAGGNDARNCAIGAVVGGGTGFLTAKSRQRKREQMLSTCIANGGPPR